MILDPIDKKLLLLLQTDSKKTTKELSLKLNLSVTAVYERIKKLEREGIIDKYVVVLINPKSRRVLLFFVI
jgi:Lrp/AsnC family leucine-responsive transcriptional regulator